MKKSPSVGWLGDYPNRYQEQSSHLPRQAEANRRDFSDSCTKSMHPPLQEQQRPVRGQGKIPKNTSLLIHLAPVFNLFFDIEKFANIDPS